MYQTRSLLPIVSAVESRGVLCVGKMPVSFPRAARELTQVLTRWSKAERAARGHTAEKQRAWLELRSLPKHSGARVLFLLVGSQISACYRTLSLNL